MAEIAVPRTPSPADEQDSPLNFISPPPPLRSASDLTPPPSTQVPKYAQPLLPGSQGDLHPTTASLRRSESTFEDSASPPPISSQPDLWNGRFPTVEEARSMKEEELRDLVIEGLIPALGETRMNLAHTQLQLNLLSIEADEAAQRAEVEHDMTRREVEVLRAAGSPGPNFRGRVSFALDPMSPLAQVQRSLDESIQKTSDVEAENHALRRRLKKAKRLIGVLDGERAQLAEDNQLLRERIRQNRDHFNAMRSSSGHSTVYALNASSATATDASRRAIVTPPPRTKASQRDSTQNTNQNPLNQLLIADQILNSDPNSVPSTPAPYRSGRPGAGHVRGTQSLSSLPATPNHTSAGRQQDVTFDDVGSVRTPLNKIIPVSHPSYSAPAPRVSRDILARAREDRDSTISASEDNDGADDDGGEGAALTDDDDLPASQASRAASSMLRQNPGSPLATASQQKTKFQGETAGGKSSKRSHAHGNGKRSRGAFAHGSETEEEDHASKKVKHGGMRDRGNSLGLGIKGWPSGQK